MTRTPFGPQTTWMTRDERGRGRRRRAGRSAGTVLGRQVRPGGSQGLGPLLPADERGAVQGPTLSRRKLPGAFDARRGVALEVGCGCGSAAAPILRDHAGWRVVAIDFAASAVERLRARRLDRVEVLLCDVVKDALPCDGVDVVLCLFVLSSIAPGALPGVVAKLGAALRPGGRFLFRDYGRYDAAQLRFGKGQKVGDHRYVKADGTSCFYFALDDVSDAIRRFRRPQSEARLPAGGEPRDEDASPARFCGGRLPEAPGLVVFFCGNCCLQTTLTPTTPPSASASRNRATSRSLAACEDWPSPTRRRRAAGRATAFQLGLVSSHTSRRCVGPRAARARRRATRRPKVNRPGRRFRCPARAPASRPSTHTTENLPNKRCQRHRAKRVPRD